VSFDWQNLTNGSFDGVPFHAAIPNRSTQYGVESEEMTIERRLQFIKRPLVDGAEIRDWGSDEEVFTASIEFFGVNHAKTAETFLARLRTGQPGLLILPTHPKAVLSYFWKRSRATSHREGNAIRVTVTWAAATVVQSAGTGKSSAFDLPQLSIDAGKSKLDADVDNALGILQDNPFLSAVRTFESGLSKIRSTVNAVLTLEQGVRNRIKTIDANILGTLALIKSATDEIQGLFGSVAVSTVARATTSLGTDSVTGQTVISVSEPDTIPAPIDPLAPPAVPTTISIPTANLDTGSGVTAFAAAVKAELASDREELAEKSVGRTEDVSRALTAVLVSLAEYVAAVATEQPTSYLVPIDMSLAEALFHNGVDLAELREILRANPQVDDPFLVAKGTVLVL
jgi:prophage DNA circulation protein